MASYERLSPEDSMFLYIETPTDQMHVGGMMVFEDAGATADEIIERVESRLHLVPKFRKKIMEVPFGQGRPVWIDDADFDIRYHVRRTGVPSPGGLDELRTLLARLMSTPLDRSRPLWELWLVDMPGDRRGVIQKTHHAVIDGISGVDVLTILLDPSPEPMQVEAQEWTPAPAPTPSELLADSIRDRLTVPAEIVRSLRAAGRAPRAATASIAGRIKGLLALGSDVLESAPDTSLRKKVGAYRRYQTCIVDLGDVKRIKDAAGTKVNDVVLTAAAGGFRALLLGRGESVDDLELRAMVPVSVRADDKRKTFGNQVSAMFADLPVGIDDARERLDAVAAWMDREKSSGEAMGAETIVDFADWAPPTLLSLASRAGLREAGATTNTVVTNVPGPQFPLYLAGGKMLEGFPYLGPSSEMSIVIAVVSYDGRMFFGIAGDWDAAPDLGVVAEGIEKTVSELVTSLTV